MKLTFTTVSATVLFGLVILPLTASGADSAADRPLETNKDKVSYSIGLDLGKYLSNMKGKIDYELLKQGIDEGFSGAEPRLSQEEITSAQEEFAAALQAEQEAQLEEMKQKNSAAGQAYLEENKAKEGVVTTDSGLQYEVLAAGDGQKPTPEDTVKVDYVGTLIDGTEFDSSIARGEPVTFPVGQVIPGWTEILQLMPVGSKYRVTIPANLAYGEAGAPPVIEPNSVLIFEVELIGIEEPLTEAAPAEAQAEEMSEDKKSE
ncbi:MAG: FKBP-type peptidyl-prolyl cis-trans isomerase [Desulfofustis sp.]|nr:FKBP-type peptidyl-prolyl cis-trans isomerase [Desulfofustis sp.]NNF47535.1 FKBP-type peptidyl-prolyl cis-trans isomerase [Desulfofustis sp.]NNK14286.1 FKBP-type peptidyl-prolyl cis-trans isomerase [Desulfofustis sp.]